MRCCLILLVLFQGWEDRKREFADAWSSRDPLQQSAAVRKLSGEDHKEAVNLLFKAARLTERTISALQKQKRKIQEEMKKYPADRILDSNGKIGKRDWYEKRLQLDKDSKEVQAGIVAHENVLAAIGETAGGYKSEAAKAVVFEEFPGGRLTRLHYYLIGAAGDALLAEIVGSHKETPFVVRALDVLSSRGGRMAEKAALLCLSRKPWQIRVAAAEAVVRLDLAEAVEPLIRAVEKTDGRIRSEMNRALVSLTGMNKHGDAAAWKDWWEKNREDFELTRPPKKERETARKEADTGKGSGNTTFYGIPIVSKRILFVIDRSGSMAARAQWQPSGGRVGDRKIDVCRSELKRAIRALAADARFNVLFYNRDIIRLNDKGLIPASKANKRKAVAFIDRVEPTGRTNIFDAMEMAMTGEVDTVFLLSDGLPNCGQFELPSEIRREIRQRNATGRIVVHTIYTGEEAGGADLLKLLASENRGRFVKRSR